MGTLGCVPAFDRYVVNQLKLYGVKQCMRRSPEMDGYRDVVLKLAECYVDNKGLFEPVRKKMRMRSGVLYPQMKLLDMGLLGLGLSR